MDEEELRRITRAELGPPKAVKPPQASLLFRIIALFTHNQLGYLSRDGCHSRTAVRTFVFLEGLTALAIISIIAYLVQLPILFPPLGPSAFILFRTPLSRPACPRSVFLSHIMAMVVGLAMLYLFALVFPDAGLRSDNELSWPRIFALSLSMGLTSLGMISLNCSHPPAAATALIAAMGFFGTWIQITALPLALIFLLLQAQFFNRVLGGLPVPLWSFNAEVANSYPDLAGLGDREVPYWEKVTEKIYEHRKH
ncbi:MAG: HPP family protein [bacterium]